MGASIAGVTFAALAFVAFRPDAIYSGDIGVKFVQAESLARAGFRSLTLAYPGEYLDPARQFFPFRPPFVLETPSGAQAIFPLPVSLLNASVIGLGGLRALTGLSVVAGFLIVWLTTWLRDGRSNGLLAIALAFATPLWFYATLPWEHAVAVAFDMVAFVVALSAPALAGALWAGLALGCGAAVREESLLLLPGLLLALWLGRRDWRAPAGAGAATLALLIALAAIEVVAYDRPLAAHVQHAVRLLTGSLPGGATVEPESTPDRVLTFVERWDIVVRYWLITDLRPWRLPLFAGGVLLAHVLMVWRRSPLGVILVTAPILAAAVAEWWTLWPAPRWVAGLFRLSPFLVFALLPLPLSASRHARARLVALITTAIVVGAALLTVNITGGKSLGPRLLLPVVPLLTFVAWDTIARYVGARRDGLMHATAAAIGLALVAVSLALHVSVLLPAWMARNRTDAEGIAYMRAAAPAVVVADDPFTAQLVFPLYFDKVVLLADTPSLAQTLAEHLSGARAQAALLVSRQDPPRVALDPWLLAGTEHRGRLVIQTWHRP